MRLNKKREKYIMFNGPYKECGDPDAAEEFCNILHHRECAKVYKNRLAMVAKNEYKYRKSGIADSLDYYCGNAYKYINKYLREESLEGKSETELFKIDVQIDRLNEDIYAGQTLAENVVLYRGVPGDVIKKMKNKLYIVDPAFMSTSLVLEEAEKFTKSHGAILKLYAPKGTPAMIVKNLTGYGRGEYEVLLPSSTGIYYMGTYKGKIGDRKYDFYEYHVGHNGIELSI